MSEYRATKKVPNHPRANSNGQVRRYILVVEKALGRHLHDEVIHHANLNESDDRNENLVVCPDQVYHMLLHRRTRAYQACGDANAHHCRYCGKWDREDVNGMRLYFDAKGRLLKHYHGDCDATWQRQQRAA